MDFRYSRPDLRGQQLRQRLERLERLFNHLLLQADGDVEAALRHLERIGRRYGLFDDDLGPEDFRRWLERRKLVRPTTSAPRTSGAGSSGASWCGRRGAAGWP
jgi:hypothetical protein